MASDTKSIDTKPIQMNVGAVETPPETSRGLSRETRLGMAVAGSFAVLVGSVFGVKQIVGVDRQSGPAAAAQVTLTDEKIVIQAPAPAFSSDPNNIKVDLTGIDMPKIPVVDTARIDPYAAIKVDLSGIDMPKMPIIDTTKAEPQSLTPRKEKLKFEVKDDFNAPTTKAGGLTLAKFEETKKIELTQKFDVPPPLPTLPASGSQTELAPITVPKIELKPIQTESPAINTSAVDLSMPPVPAMEPVKRPEQATLEINVTVPKLQDFSTPPAPFKTNPQELPKMEPPLKVEVPPLNVGEATIKPMNNPPVLQPMARSGDGDPARIDLESVKPKGDTPRTTIMIPATMENREPRTIPVVTAVRRNAKDFDEDLHEPKPGDNYAMISKKYYDDAGYAAALAEYNKSNPTNNKMVRIPPLWVLEQNHAKAMPVGNIRTTSMTAPANDRRDNAPPPPNAESREESKSSPFNGMRVYTVARPGETLRSIAQNQLGNANAWKSVKDYNISVDENAELSPGTKLYMPPGARE